MVCATLNARNVTTMAQTSAQRVTYQSRRMAIHLNVSANEHALGNRRRRNQEKDRELLKMRHLLVTPNTTTPGLSFSRVAVPKSTGWQHVRQETGDRCCAIRRTHIAHEEEDGRGRRGTMLNLEHADEDKDECSTRAIFIAQSDLHETKLQGEREAEKDKVGMLSSTRLSTCTTKEECETDKRPRSGNSSINMARQKKHTISVIGARRQSEYHPIPVTAEIKILRRAESCTYDTNLRHTALQCITQRPASGIQPRGC